MKSNTSDIQTNISLLLKDLYNKFNELSESKMNEFLIFIFTMAVATTFFSPSMIAFLAMVYGASTGVRYAAYELTKNESIQKNTWIFPLIGVSAALTYAFAGIPGLMLATGLSSGWYLHTHYNARMNEWKNNAQSFVEKVQASPLQQAQSAVYNGLKFLSGLIMKVETVNTVAPKSSSPAVATAQPAQVVYTTTTNSEATTSAPEQVQLDQGENNTQNFAEKTQSAVYNGVNFLSTHFMTIEQVQPNVATTDTATTAIPQLGVTPPLTAGTAAAIIPQEVTPLTAGTAAGTDTAAAIIPQEVTTPFTAGTAAGTDTATSTPPQQPEATTATDKPPTALLFSENANNNVQKPQTDVVLQVFGRDVISLDRKQVVVQPGLWGMAKLFVQSLDPRVDLVPAVAAPTTTPAPEAATAATTATQKRSARTPFMGIM